MAEAAARDPEIVALEMFSRGDVPCMPSDELFADSRDEVSDTATPKLFIGAVLVDRYTVVKYIESGTFGRGWVAADNKLDGKRVFVKTFRSGLDRPNPCDVPANEIMIAKEIEVLLQARANRIPDHPSLVNGMRVSYGRVVVPQTGRVGDMFFLVSPDLCEGGELYNYLVFGDGIQKFDEPIARYFFKQLAEGVAHMHRHGLFHRDLKLENIVLDARYNARIMDFGHSKHASECHKSVDKASGAAAYSTLSFVGTSAYQPPELKKDSSSYDPAAFDMWSLGVILFFLVGIEGLAAKDKDFTFMAKVRRKDPGYEKLLGTRRSDGIVPDNALFWEYFGPALNFSPELKHLINGLFNIMPKQRFTIDQVLAHKWLAGPMPTHDEVVAAMSGRHGGIIERDFYFKMESSQSDALAELAAAVTPLAPFVTVGHKLAVCDPPKYVVAVNRESVVRVMWLLGGIDEWLQFRHLLCVKLRVVEDHA